MTSESIRIDAQLCLEPIAPSHTRPLYELIEADREDLRRWLIWIDETPDEATMATALQRMADNRAAGREAVFCIVWEGKPAGVISLHAISAIQRRAEIGYWLARCARGRGLATRAARALIEYGFEQLGLHRVAILCAEENLASRAVPERLGLTAEATLQDYFLHHGQFHNAIVYAIIAPRRTP